jgi:hypothetical protein
LHLALDIGTSIGHPELFSLNKARKLERQGLKTPLPSLPKKSFGNIIERSQASFLW